MTLSRSKQRHTTSGLVAIALCSAAGIGAAQAQAPDAATRYAQIVADADITARYNGTIEAQVRSQQGEITALQAQLAGMDATAGAIPTMVQKMFDGIESFVAGDVPFLAKERAQRISRLRELMSAPDKSIAEKFRRLLEAYTIEMEYGRTMDSYRDTLPDGKEADFVRLGRISLLYRTTDGSDAGYWDQQKKAWVPAPEYSRSIDLALRIAKQTTAPDLITVPVPAPGGRS